MDTATEAWLVLLEHPGHEPQSVHGGGGAGDSPSRLLADLKASQAAWAAEDAAKARGKGLGGQTKKRNLEHAREIGKTIPDSEKDGAPSRPAKTQRVVLPRGATRRQVESGVLEAHGRAEKLIRHKAIPDDRRQELAGELSSVGGIARDIRRREAGGAETGRLIGAMATANDVIARAEILIEKAGRGR